MTRLALSEVSVVSSDFAVTAVPVTSALQTRYTASARSPLLIEPRLVALPWSVTIFVLSEVLMLSVVLPKSSFAQWFPPVTFNESDELSASALRVPLTTTETCGRQFAPEVAGLPDGEALPVVVVVPVVDGFPVVDGLQPLPVVSGFPVVVVGFPVVDGLPVAEQSVVVTVVVVFAGPFPCGEAANATAVPRVPTASSPSIAISRFIAYLASPRGQGDSLYLSPERIPFTHESYAVPKKIYKPREGLLSLEHDALEAMTPIEQAEG
jgi:hypothetical protein